MSSIDLSKCKKISQDKNVALFSHPDGHQVKVAISALSPAMRQKLEKLPIHKAEAGLVESPDSTPPKDMVSDAKIAPEPEVATVAEPAEKEVPVEAVDGEVPESADAKEVAPAVAQPGAPAVQAATATAPAAPMAQEQAPVSDGNDLNDKVQEHDRFIQDLASGQITPKTYKDLLFNNYEKDKNGNEIKTEKSGLGKVGALFGLLLSGIGSGITHQPNMLMDMMNKQISNDLEAQKQTKESNRNFLSVQYQHNLQQAQASEHKMRVLGEFPDALKKFGVTVQMMKDLGYSDDEVSRIRKDFLDNAAKAWAEPEAKAKIRDAYGHSLSNATQNNPQGNNVYNSVVKPKINEANLNDLKQGQAKVTALAATTAKKIKEGNPSTFNGRQSAVDEKKLSDAILLGERGGAGSRNSIDPRHVDKITEEKDTKTYNRNLARDVNDTFNALAGMSNAGQVPGVGLGVTSTAAGLGALLGPITSAVAGTIGHKAGEGARDFFERRRNIEVNAIMDRLGYNKSDASKRETIESLLPAWNDKSPEQVKRVHERMVQHFKSLEKPGLLETYGKRIPGLVSKFPDLPFTPKDPYEESDRAEKEKREGPKKEPASSKKPESGKEDSRGFKTESGKKWGFERVK